MDPYFIYREKIHILENNLAVVGGIKYTVYICLRTTNAKNKALESSL